MLVSQRLSLARSQAQTLSVLFALAVASAGVYLTAFLDWDFLQFALLIRGPRLAAIVLAGVAIGAASMVFQTLIANRIVTPCLLGMNSLYVLIHTAVAFFLGTRSVFVSSPLPAFVLDLLLMGPIAYFLYSTLFKKTRTNVLYILLIGTVLATLFSSLQTSLTRAMDPGEYDALISTLIANFTTVNQAVILPGGVLLVLIGWSVRKELALLDVMNLGRALSINLGVDYDAAVRRLLLAVALSIAVATAVVGPISFLGLITANLARQSAGTYRHAFLVPASCAYGVIVLSAAQSFVEHAMNYAVPVSVFISLGGGMYFLYLLLTQKS